MMVDSENTVGNATEAIGQYLHEIHEVPLLSAQEEREVAKRCLEGDENAVRTLVKANLRLVVHIAREYAGRGVPLLDLIQEGSIGLITAARKFDYAMDCRFSTYAANWIRRGVTRCLLSNDSLIHIPVHKLERINQIKALREKMRTEMNTEPTDADVALELGIPVETVQHLMSVYPHMCSLDESLDEEPDFADLPQENIIRRELDTILQNMLSTLTERQRQVITLYFGFKDGIEHSFEEIGSILGISKERARQLEHQAIAKMQKIGNDYGLGDFL